MRTDTRTTHCNDVTTCHLPMSMCGENLAVGRTESMPLLSLSFSPLTGTWSLWMAAGWSWNYEDGNKYLFLEFCLKNNKN